jgi:hypothetical protein
MLEGQNIVSACQLAGRNLTFEFHDFRTLTQEEMGRLVGAWLSDKRHKRTKNKRIVAFTLVGAHDPIGREDGWR